MMERNKNNVGYYHAVTIFFAISALLLPPSPYATTRAYVIPPGRTTRPRGRTTTSLPPPPRLFGSAGGPSKATKSSASPPDTSLTPIPRGISPFEKSLSRSIDVQSEFRNVAKRALDAALRDGLRRIEFEFPPLLGGAKSKSQFDDYDNVQELNANKEWTMLFAPKFLGDAMYQGGRTWLIFPDLKECELAKGEWTGRRYTEATFTTIEAATDRLASLSGGEGGGGYDAPWGSGLVSGLSKIMGGANGDAGLLGDVKSLDPIIDGANYPATLWLVIQPGNGGPVEDWVNCEKMHDASPGTPMVIVNGALDKVRGGFYPAIFFPKLARTVDRFYDKFDTVFYIKPISDKGVYGWLYRVYPEPWQVVYEDVRPGKDGNPEVKYVTVGVSDKRPAYADVVSLLVGANQNGK